MQYSVITNPTEAEINEIVALYTEAFQRNKIFFDGVFHHDIKAMRCFMDIAMRFAARTEKSEFCVSRDENGRMCAVALWRFPNSPTIDIGSVTRAKLSRKMIVFFLTYFGSAIRITKLGAIEDKNRYSKPHYYLFLLGSVKNGEGKALMGYSMPRYNDYDLYVESCSLPNNHVFYRSLGFELLGETEMYGEKNGYMVIKRRQAEN